MLNESTVPVVHFLCCALPGSCCQLACFNYELQVIRLLPHTLFTSCRAGRPLALTPTSQVKLKSKEDLYTAHISTWRKIPTSFFIADFCNDLQTITLLSLLVSLLHGHQRREVSLIVGEDQRGAVTAARRHLKWQIEPSKRDWSKCWN